MSETTEPQDLIEFKDKLYALVLKKQAQYDWCDEPIRWLKNEMDVHPPAQADFFPAGTILAVDRTVYFATKHFGVGDNRWEFGGPGASMTYQDMPYEEMTSYMRRQSTPRPVVVLRYGETVGHENQGKVFNIPENRLEPTPAES